MCRWLAEKFDLILGSQVSRHFSAVNLVCLDKVGANKGLN